MSENKEVKYSCNVSKKCGGCRYIGMTYEQQLDKKQEYVNRVLKEFGKIKRIIGMENPKEYRNKVHHALSRDKKGNVISGCYEADTHKVVMAENCILEDRKSKEVIATIRELLKSFKIQIFNEKSGYGLVRHVLIRRGFTSGELMVVIVAVSPIFPSKNNFVKALRNKHPEITTVVLNVNDRFTSMVLGPRNITLYGPGFIKDTLCERVFRISPSSFYQINPVQTEKLYAKAIEFAGLSGQETVIDAYCGIGTIGIAASKKAGKVIGVELNADAVKDAAINVKENKIDNAVFFQGDAGDFMINMAERHEKADVVLMDPPRSGSTKEFLDAVVKMGPKRVVYVSCNPSTQAEDLKYITKKGYTVKEIQPYDLFPWTEHVETVALLSKKHVNPKAYVEIGVDDEEYYKIKGDKH